jgi:amidophosphoribosyltransferase
MPAVDELIAHGRTDEEVQQEIGADWLVYQDLDDLIEAVNKGNPEIERFDNSVFTGEYVTGNVGPDYLNGLREARNDSAKSDRRSSDDEAIDLHNTA